MRTRLLFLLAFFFFFCTGESQNTIGLPDIINFSKQSYRAGAQVRQIRQDKKGWLYFANNEGVLTYDGVNWKVHPLPNKSIVRSLEFGPDGHLYVGGQDEFGYLKPNSQGKLIYHSLKNLIPEKERSFTDVWEIYFFNNDIFFQTSEKIFQLSNNNITVFKGKHWKLFSKYGNKLIAQDADKGLLQFKNGVWTPFVTDSELPGDFFGTSITEIGRDSAMLTTIKNGIYIIHNNKVTKLKSPFVDELSTKNISASVMVNDHHIAIATNLDGCYIIDKKGNLVRSFRRKEGLQNNNILEVFLDKEKNLWLGLDNGIDFIAYNNAIKHIYPDYQNEGSGYASYLYNNELFIGTSNGLYKVPLENIQDISYVKGSFTPVKNTSGQVWNLSEVNGKLMMGHHEGGFSIENNAAVPIDKSSGFWTFQPLDNVLPSSLMITGTYNGINTYLYNNGSFITRNVQAHFESARFIVIHNNKIWVTHPYKGVYNIEFVNNKPQVKQYLAKDGIPSVNGNYVFKVKNNIILSTEKGILVFNENKNGFEPSDYYNNLFNGKHVHYLKEDADGNIWFVYNKIIGVVDYSNKKEQIIYFPELANKIVSGFEHVNPINKNNVLVGGDKGFYHINYEQYKKIKYPLEVYINTVLAIKNSDSVLFSGYYKNANNNSYSHHSETKISHSWNSFYFSFASPVYAQNSNIEYSYYLEGFDDKWSDFSKKTEKEYTNLPAGTYTFKVKARNNLGNESPVNSYKFTVLSPWYQTYWAYGFYTLLVFIAAFFLHRSQKKKFALQQKRHEEEQKRLQYLHQLELEKTEKEIIKLKNEKLEVEIEHKNTELASTAMHLVQKGELLTRIKEEMVKAKKNVEEKKSPDDFKKIIKILNEEDKMDKDWENFAIHFDKVHSDFLTALKSNFPNLTPNELKLSAYLRMNLSSKEVAQLMNISVRGVEISRYRVRKKLGISTETNLFEFLMNIKEKSSV